MTQPHGQQPLRAPLWEGPAVLLVDLDAFFASVEQLDHPEWRGKPVIVGGDADKRGVVSTASYEARAYGVHSAMAASQARMLCPDGIWCSGHFGRYREMSERVMDILLDESPHLQQVSIDEAFLDVSPTIHIPSDPVEVAQRIQRRVSELGITCSVGVGSSKAVAKVASDRDKPQGLTVVYPGREEAFLRDLPIACMSGIGPVAQSRLKTFGIATLGQVAQADTSILSDIFGKNATLIRDRCIGKDGPVDAASEPMKSLSHELSFAVDLENLDDIEAACKTVCSKVCRRLRKKNLAAGTITLKVRYGDRSLHTAQRALSPATDSEAELSRTLIGLLDQVWTPRQKIRLVGCSASKLQSKTDALRKPEQASLFDETTTDQQKPNRIEHLNRATDIVRDRFGEGALKFGREMRTEDNTTGSAAKNPEDYK